MRKKESLRVSATLKHTLELGKPLQKLHEHASEQWKPYGTHFNSVAASLKIFFLYPVILQPIHRFRNSGELHIKYNLHHPVPV